MRCLAITLAGLFLCSLCCQVVEGQKAAENNTAVKESSPPKPEGQSPESNDGPREVIKVATPEEFVLAIKSNRVIQLTADEYSLSEVKDRWMEFVRWDREFDGKSLTIRNVKNLSIVGAGEKPARLIVGSAYAFVLHFEKCQDIKLGNLVLGHAPKRGTCQNGVVGATQCQGLWIRKCDLFGCGTEGLTLKNVQNMTFEDSIIRDCSYGILTVTGCRDLKFQRARFVKNEEFWGMNFEDSKDILFSDCIVEDNSAKGPLLQATSCSNIQFQGGVIHGNSATVLVDGADAISFDRTKTESSLFIKAK